MAFLVRRYGGVPRVLSAQRAQTGSLGAATPDKGPECEMEAASSTRVEPKVKYNKFDLD